MNLQEIKNNIENKNLIYQKHPFLPLTIYNYSVSCQYSKNWNHITKMARGLILDDLGNIVARPFEKFFNFNELDKPLYSYTKDLNSFKVEEKLDGSLIIVTRYNNDLIVSSRKAFTSWHAKIAEEMLSNFFPVQRIEEGKTYLFELIHVENKIVIKYDKNCLVLLSIIDNKSGKEIVISELEKYTDDERSIILRPKQYKLFGSFNELVYYMNSNIGDGTEEGYVVTFSDGFKVKLKYQKYIILHRYMTDLSINHIINYIKDYINPLYILEINSKDNIELKSYNLDNIVKEFIQYSEDSNIPDEIFTKVKQQFNYIMLLFDIYFKRIEKKYSQIVNNKNPKDYKSIALCINHECSINCKLIVIRSALFSYMRNDITGLFNEILKIIKKISHSL